ncbi:hypothetical protein [Paraburkholderia sp.]|uniref:hypothetical protein n=1 Tax=Paraburkholderia sp. TaxID=1926495 RepID=UPI00286F3A81|nr:hypothetical protein [Paraburkholderia sp.]
MFIFAQAAIPVCTGVSGITGRPDAAAPEKPFFMQSPYNQVYSDQQKSGYFLALTQKITVQTRIKTRRQSVFRQKRAKRLKNNVPIKI